MKVEKRDGTIQPFKFEKIERAVSRVFNNKPLRMPVPEGFMLQLEEHFTQIIAKHDKKDPDYAMPIEEIQDTIRDFLNKKKEFAAAESFIKYRADRERIREQKSWMMKEITRKIKGNDVENQNANLDEASFGGRMGEANRVVLKDYALKYLVSKMARDNHNNNLIYIHDLDSYAVGMHNCLSIPFDDLLKNGFNTRQTDVRPANSVNTACQLVAVIFQLQSLQQFGGVGATHLDWTMVPYVRKSFEKHYLVEYVKECDGFLDLDLLTISDEDLHKFISKCVEQFFLEYNFVDEDFKFANKDKFDGIYYQRALYETRKEIYQGVEGMYHNLNTLQSRSGNQLPFTSINYGTCTEPEGRLFTRALLEVSMEGLGKFGRTSIFPCGIFQYMKGVNDKPGTPNYDLYRLALKSTSKRLYPNYVNVNWSNNAGYDPNDPRTYTSTMGCRTYNGFDINGLGQLKDGRGNLAPVTIIMPTLAMMALDEVLQKGTYINNEEKQKLVLDKFISLLNKKIDEAKDMLIERFNYMCSQSPASAKFMYENNTMAGYVPEEGIISALKHGTLVIGQIGLAETLEILIGCDHTTEKGMELAKKIEALFNKRCAEFKKEYKLNFGVYYSPAENLCYTSFKKWKDKYGDMENVTYYIDEDGNRHEKLYFTNSMHVPVYKEMSPFKKIDIESQLTGYSNAGCITYVEVLHDAIHNIDALEELVNYAMEKDIPYLGLNLPSDTCTDCGYQGYIGDKCPKCGSEHIERLRRVCGYLTGDYKTAFNKGKQVEVTQRVIHTDVTSFE